MLGIRSVSKSRTEADNKLQSPQLSNSRFLRLLDLALVTTALFMVITDEIVLLFHVVFVLLSVGAFYWPFRSFLLRAFFWVTVDSLYVLHAVNVGKPILIN
ncbi:MAG: hypothetical protein HC856_01810 [Pseudanabaena sp. RU_4_16]|nr:hypothetical protein [Pseudanabaena sp. RU_4_16]